MIKKFEEYINEDYFSKLANRKDNGNIRKENEITKDFVTSYCDDNYKNFVKSISFRKENGKPIVDINGDFFLRKDVEEIPFQFGTVTGDFDCNGCTNLASLEGCPKKVTGDFVCSYCDKLTSLDGCPIEVGGVFYCNGCENLISAEGCPKKVDGDFYCSDCCDFFNKRMVKSLCDVKGKIYI